MADPNPFGPLRAVSGERTRRDSKVASGTARWWATDADARPQHSRALRLFRSDAISRGLGSGIAYGRRELVGVGLPGGRSP